MNADEIKEYCITALKDTVLTPYYGEAGIFYNPNKVLTYGVNVLTIKEKDGKHDNASHVNREGIYRVNLGLRKETFINMFHKIPARPSAGETGNMEYDFSKLDCIMPHPVYA